MTKLGPGIVPSLPAPDLEVTTRFYERCGFHRSGRHEEDGRPFWLKVSRDDGAALQFFEEPPRRVHPKPCLSGTLYIPASDVDVLAEELSSRVAFAWGPETLSYGVRELAVRDPNGYFIAFAMPARGESPAAALRPTLG